jgi:RNA-binding protein YhbY
MDKLKGSQKKYLRSQAHHLKPLVIIGAKGVTHLANSRKLKKEYPKKSLKPQKAR